MKKEHGFTLIELIIVIVILGILAVTAAPRFFDFSKDARISTLGGLKAALQGAAQIEYAKKAINGEELTYPAPTIAGIAAAVGITEDEWDIHVESGLSLIGFAPKGFNDPRPTTITFTNIKQCYVVYRALPPTPPAAPIFEIEVVDNGC